MTLAFEPAITNSHNLATRAASKEIMISVILNGEARQLSPGTTVHAMLEQLGLDTRKVAVERNLEIVPKSAFAATALADGDKIEVVHFIGGGREDAAEDTFTVAKRTFTSRLLVGTGKYKDFDETRRAIEASGAQIVTVAIRRTNIGQDAGAPNLLDVLPP
ncbi:MAG: sulfur carrier protein ThiS, partial [Rhodobacteraceae bacterium]|nr:sulfur carrier protein ThiS [Paracoccaceae bacterium]